MLLDSPLSRSALLGPHLSSFEFLRLSGAFSPRQGPTCSISTVEERREEMMEINCQYTFAVYFCYLPTLHWLGS